MTDEIIPPQNPPPVVSHSLGATGSFLSASGIGLMTLTMLGSAGAATVWAGGKLLGAPNWLLLPFFALVGVGVLWATIWATGRAWHVEKNLEAGRDIDTPVFSLLYYFRKTPPQP